MTLSAPAIETVRQEISPDDRMFAGNSAHYFSVGVSALRVVLAAVSLAGGRPPARILDFGAGAGRVTRWMMAAFPEAAIDACDVREEDMAFLREAFGIDARAISPNLDLLTIPGSYDLIWVGSVITHLSESGTRRLVDKLVAQLQPGGLLVLTFHGRHAIWLRDSGAIVYIQDEDAWQRIRHGYFTSGYGYADYPGEAGYGISACRTNWMVDLVNGLTRSRLVLLSDRAWDNHHDVVAIQRTA